MRGRAPSKITPADLKYEAMEQGINPRIAVAKATVIHRRRDRMFVRLRKAKGEARRNDNPDILEDAYVNEILKIIGG